MNAGDAAGSGAWQALSRCGSSTFGPSGRAQRSVNDERATRCAVVYLHLESAGPV